MSKSTVGRRAGKAMAKMSDELKDEDAPPPQVPPKTMQKTRPKADKSKSSFCDAPAMFTALLVIFAILLPFWVNGDHLRLREGRAAVPTRTGSWAVIMVDTRAVCAQSGVLPNNHLFCLERPHLPPYPPNQNLFKSATSIDTMVDINVGKSTPTASIIRVTQNAYGSGMAQFGNGSIAIIGGDSYNIGTYTTDGRLAKRVLNPCITGCTVGSIAAVGPMSSPRWFPTVVTMVDGSVMIIGGNSFSVDAATSSVTDLNPTYEYHPAKAAGPITLNVLSSLFPFSLRPWACILPSGRVFVHVGSNSVLIDPTTDTVDSTTIPAFSTATQRTRDYPYTAAVVLLPLTLANGYTTTILVCGGVLKSSNPDSNPGTDLTASNFCNILNPDAVSPSWTAVDPMPNARVMADATLLPDGTVLFTNGASYGMAGGVAGSGTGAQPVLGADLFDPTAPAGSQWTSLAAATVPRLYASGSLLLADGRVVTVGSDNQNWNDAVTFGATCTVALNCTDPFEYRMEAFSPPYLSLGTRPVISSVQTPLTYGTVFFIKYSGATSISMVTLVRYSTTAASVNTDQRTIQLSITSQQTGVVFVASPFSGMIAPPGHYHLFILAGGVPSVASMITLPPTSSNGTVIVESPAPSAGASPASAASPSAAAAGSGGATAAKFLSAGMKRAYNPWGILNVM
ncbi:hypothetical protein SmJEL517_g05212 [Synchytrium microbalum]|uniref:Galactose oxidase-like Early set domain-containing protein n=1 Tax=Synchytrium microbalum TaxID=1806994 RepID=A0A507BVG4_9FUNG|nr:uncharacterized protein SmJEL517_g05212 [Synchytrium microbalum]TPX31492.1 hypothetical protein SmJEL517_g05212 [Synchytrium microbalum]